MKFFAFFETFCSKIRRIGTEARKENKGKSTAISLCALRVLLFKKFGGLERRTGSFIDPILRSNGTMSNWCPENFVSKGQDKHGGGVRRELASERKVVAPLRQAEGRRTVAQ
ncbi:MAG: hypothetical protein JJU29_18375 [Verrucomicrobia bacterium]|nr:hypothetical protein [Verrucomicrobiota bacterium]MCH8513947.1 hypothetical protein [Kiritimatiellia bacterium]